PPLISQDRSPSTSRRPAGIGTAAANELPVAGLHWASPSAALDKSRGNMRYSVVTPIDVTGSISAACGRVNKKFRPFAPRPEEARQVPAKRRRQASFGAEEDEKRREGGGGQGGEPGRRRGLPAGRQGGTRRRRLSQSVGRCTCRREVSSTVYVRNRPSAFYAQRTPWYAAASVRFRFGVAPQPAGDGPAGLPGRADLGQEPAVQTVPAGHFPRRHNQDGHREQDRVAAGGAGQHERHVHEGAEEGGDAGEGAENQAETDQHLTDDDQLGEPGVVAALQQEVQERPVPVVVDGRAAQRVGEVAPQRGAGFHPRRIEQLPPPGRQPLPSEPYPDDCPKPGKGPGVKQLVRKRRSTNLRHFQSLLVNVRGSRPRRLFRCQRGTYPRLRLQLYYGSRRPPGGRGGCPVLTGRLVRP